MSVRISDGTYGSDYRGKATAAAARKYARSYTTDSPEIVSAWMEDDNGRVHFNFRTTKKKGQSVAHGSPGSVRLNRGNPKRKRATSRRKKNPVRVAASMAGKSTGWMPAKAVRVVKGKGGQVRVDVKR